MNPALLFNCRNFDENAEVEERKNQQKWSKIVKIAYFTIYSFYQTVNVHKMATP